MPSELHVAYVVAFLATILFVVLFARYAAPLGLVDQPTQRKRHERPTPLVGGIAMYAAFLASYAVFVPDWTFLPFVLAAGILTFIGVLDDRHDLHVRRRFLLQIALVATVVMVTDVQIQSLGNLFGFGEILLGPLAVPFTVFAIVGAMNAFNMIDGMDGLAGSLAVVSLASLSMAAHGGAHSVASLILDLLLVASLGFLTFNLRTSNRRRARVFMGDAGSMLLGFAIAYFAVYLTQQENAVMAPVGGLWVAAVPLLDAFRVMYKRLCASCSVARGDRNHVHHVLQDAGFSVCETLVLLTVSAVALAFVGFLTANRPELEPVVFGLFCLTFAAHSWAMERIASGRFPVFLERDSK